MVASWYNSALVSGSSTPDSSPCRGHCILFLGKTLNSSSTSIQPGKPGYALAWWATGPLRVYLIGTACYSGAKKVDSQKPSLCFIQNAAVLIAKGWKETNLRNFTAFWNLQFHLVFTKLQFFAWKLHVCMQQVLLFKYMQFTLHCMYWCYKQKRESHVQYLQSKSWACIFEEKVE